MSMTTTEYDRGSAAFADWAAVDLEGVLGFAADMTFPVDPATPIRPRLAGLAH